MLSEQSPYNSGEFKMTHQAPANRRSYYIHTYGVRRIAYFVFRASTLALQRVFFVFVWLTYGHTDGWSPWPGGSINIYYSSETSRKMKGLRRCLKYEISYNPIALYWFKCTIIFMKYALPKFEIHDDQLKDLWFMQNICAINDPLGQTHSPASSVHYSHLKL